MRFLLALLPLIFIASNAIAGTVLFDVAERRAKLQQPAYAQAVEYCMAQDVKWHDMKLPDVVPGLKATEGYGSDASAGKFVFYLMLQGGRALAGDAEANTKLIEAYRTWAQAGALLQTDTNHDTYYALKRLSVALIVNYTIIADSLGNDDRALIENWIDKIARPLGKYFDGDVDRNNHRILADSVLMAWGAYTGDDALYDIGRKGFERILNEARPDGSMPLETRRGARALWYIRHALVSLTLMAEIAKHHGEDYYSKVVNTVSFDTLLNYFLNAQRAPHILLQYSSENYIPGPSLNYLEQDLGYLNNRGNGRHYMAFGEVLSQRDSFASQRLKLLLQQEVFEERPLIDEYFGGNISCFFWEPENS